MKRPSSASPARRTALAAAAALVLGVLSGCGGDDSGQDAAATSSDPVVTMSSADAKRFEDNVPKPEVQARNLVGFGIRDWIDYLRYDWGVKPKVVWTALKEDRARWRVQALITGDGAGERLEPEWLVYIPLDEAPTEDDMRRADEDDSIQPVDAEARRLARVPPLIPGNRAELEGSLEVDDGAFVLEVDDELGLDDEPGVASVEQRRGREAIGGARGIKVRIAPDARTRITDSQGKRLTLAEFRDYTDQFGNDLLASVDVGWKLDRVIRTRADLEGSAPATIKVLTP